jgi:NADH-quinone oxidoreductase subunit A
LETLNSYIPVMVMGIGATIVAAVLIGLSALLGPRRPSPAKVSAYECGVTAVGSARERFPIKFYLTAMLFIVFDIETIFLYPWAVTFRSSGGMMLFNLAEMGVFVAILFAGYAYVWRRGGLEWA